jgi:hypothetical protein
MLKQMVCTVTTGVQRVKLKGKEVRLYFETSADYT